MPASETTTQQQSRFRQEQQQWPLTRLIAFATTTLVVAVVLMFLVVGVIINVFQPDLGDQPLLVPLLGACLISGTFLSLLGIVAGIHDLMTTHDRRGISVWAVVMNSVVCLFVFSVVAMGFIRTNARHQPASISSGNSLFVSAPEELSSPSFQNHLLESPPAMS